MADEGDLSQQSDEFHTGILLKGARERYAAQCRRPSATECANCGDTIPVERQIAVPGCQLCVVCQTIEERGW
ncbi:MAG: TraR/DksA C4-type zinc finger protein [Pseudomonadota bacterium]